MPRRLPMPPQRQESSLLALPPELLLHLLASLPLDSLLALSRTSRTLHNIVIEQALPAFLRERSFAPVTARPFSPAQSRSRVHDALWTERIQHAWSSMRLRAETLGGPIRGEWHRRVMPLVRLWPRGPSLPSRVVVARGEELDLWQVRSDGSSECVPMLGYGQTLGRTGANARGVGKGGAWHDITGVDVVGDDLLILSRINGLVQRVRVVEPWWDGRAQRWNPGWLEEVARYEVGQALSKGQETETSVQAMSTGGDVLATATTTRPRALSRGQRNFRRTHQTSTKVKLTTISTTPVYNVSFSRISAPWEASTVLPLEHKPWSLLLEPSTTSPTWLAVGTSSDSPLNLYELGQDGRPVQVTTPRALGYAPNDTVIDHVTNGGPPLTSSTPRPNKRTSVYGLCTPHALSTTLNPHQTLIAAYYDSTTRIYDLRTRDRHALTLTLRDPLSDDACYTVTSGGPYGAYVLTGSARHGAVRVWDVRNYRLPLMLLDDDDDDDGGGRGGRTMFSPGRDQSPVYSLVSEFSRVWGVTDRRAFVFDYDHDYNRDQSRAMRGRYGEGVGSVSWYEHGGKRMGQLRRGGLDNRHE